jgi:DNA-binding transcriptional regulator PaaX
MEVAVQQRIGYLQRYKEMANFKITSFQKQLEESVPILNLEEVNKQYNEVVQNYRQLLDKQDIFENRNEALLKSEVIQNQLFNFILFD